MIIRYTFMFHLHSLCILPIMLYPQKKFTACVDGIFVHQVEYSYNF